MYFANTCNVFSQKKAVFLNDHILWADSVIATLTEEERIAQLFMVAAYSNKGDVHRDEIQNLVENYKVGGLMFLQGGPLRQAKLTNYYQSKSKIPLMIAIDAEWGVAMRLDSALSFPWQMTLGAIQDTGLIYEMGVEIARQCKLLGVHVNFAPVIDVNSNPENPIINNRSFGENPQRVGMKGVAYMKGMQDNNVLACAKHFPGHGDTYQDSHKTLPVVQHSRSHLNEVDLLPYKMLINNGLGSVMTAHLHVPSLDDTKNLAVSLSSKAIQGLLRRELGFTGLSFTDALNMQGVSKFYSPGEVDLKALLAGNDVLLLSEDVPKAITKIKEAINQKKISQSEIDQRCRKILLAKRWMGLDSYKPVNLTDVKQHMIIDKTRNLDVELVQSSLTLLQNYNDLIPLNRLDTLRIASVSIGDEGKHFSERLSCYADVTHFNISEKSSLSEKSALLEDLSQFNLVIASVHKSNANPWKSYKISKQTDILLQSIAMQSKVIVSIFANPYSINSFLFVDNYDAMLLSYQNSKIAQEQTAQGIFGGVEINGKIPVNTKHFSFDTGLETDRCRMRYVSPQQINLDSNLVYKIDSIVEYAISEEAMPGCQILISKDADIFFNKSYGYHTYEKNRLVTNRDVYDIASITKIIATVPVLMEMVDSDLLDLDDNIGSYLDLDSTDKSDLVFRHILAHQAGFTAWIPFYKGTLIKDSITGLLNLRDSLYSSVKSEKYPYNVAQDIYIHNCYSDSILQQIKDSQLSTKSGSFLSMKEYRYSDLGYYLFKEIIERTYKQSLNNIVADMFYKPLGMASTGYLPLYRMNVDRIIPTELDVEFRGQLLTGYVHDQGAAMQGGVGGHAGVFSNANDLAKMMQMYLQKGNYGGYSYLSKEVISDFTACQFPENNNRRGAGFDKPILEGQKGGPTCDNISSLSFGHSGFTGTLAWADPITGINYVFLSNRIHPDANNKKLLKMDVRTEIMKVIFDSIDDR